MVCQAFLRVSRDLATACRRDNLRLGWQCDDETNFDDIEE